MLILDCASEMLYVQWEKLFCCTDEDIKTFAISGSLTVHAVLKGVTFSCVCVPAAKLHPDTGDVLRTRESLTIVWPKLIICSYKAVSWYNKFFC